MLQRRFIPNRFEGVEGCFFWGVLCLVSGLESADFRV